MQNNLKGISLFSGAGGMDIGAIRAGVDVVACVELDRNACATLRHNHERTGQTTNVFEGSILEFTPQAVSESVGLGPGDVDIIFGGPPCQSFSQIGKQQSVGDPRGLLIFQMIEYARYFQPPFLVIENVKGLISAPDAAGTRGGVLTALISEIASLGYQVDWRVLNAADFGVAQKRQRLFIVASRQTKPSLPIASHSPTSSSPGLWESHSYVTVADALKGLNRPGKKGSPRTDSHVDVTPAGDIRRISGVPEGSFLASCFHLPDSQRGRLTKKDTTKFLRVGRSKQANTLRCGEIFFHPTQDRYLTPREYMRIHGYPDDYELKGPIRGRSGQARELDQHRLVANSVPPPLAEAVFQSLLARDNTSQIASVA